jgi:hypothetical protein
METTGGVRAIAILAIAFWCGTGLWAFVSPASFYEVAAVFPPYNAHFLRDAGAFMFGLGAAVALALRPAGALFVVLAAGAVAGVLHVISHIVDRAQGGSVATTIGLAVVAVLFGVGAMALQRRGAPSR